MSVFVNGIEVTTEELKTILNELNGDKVLELTDVDRCGNLYFETNKYGTYY